MTGNDLAAELQRLVAERVAEAVKAERERIAATLRAAAAGRREYAPNAASLGVKTIGYAELLDLEASTIESCAEVAEGELQPLYGWLPSWRWTDEMNAALHDATQKPQDPPSGAAHMESHQPHPENGRTAATAGRNGHPDRTVELPNARMESR